MNRDIRQTKLYKEAEGLWEILRQPGTGQVTEAIEVHASPDGTYAVFAGILMDNVETTSALPPTRICRIDLSSGDTRVLTFGPHVDRLPKISSDGRHVAFLSDRAIPGDFQLYWLDPVTGAARITPRVNGWVEYLQWSPDGKRILLGVAGHGADRAGGQGAARSAQSVQSLPPWIPHIETGHEEVRWRRAWIYELTGNRMYPVSMPETNVWEATWCGSDALAAVVSSGPGEGLWYSARLQIIPARPNGKGEGGSGRDLYVPRDQLGGPAVSPSGKHLAVVEAVCSDRGSVAGELRLIAINSGRVRRIDTRGVDITCTEWRSDQKLLVAGHRGFETVLGICDVANGKFMETWVSREITGPGFYITFSGLNEAGDCVLSGRGFTRAPEIGSVRGGQYRTVKSFDHGYLAVAKVLEAVEALCWNAPDGLEVQGWLLKPKGKAPYPVVLNVHGGPVWHWRPFCLSALYLMLLKRGYALFLTNPRGSSGRGQDFARRVMGDMGGAETADHLSGIDFLVKQGLADPKRLGLMGGSHGGFMTSWIITQDKRFAAAVSVAPVTNWVSEHLISNIPHFCSLALGDRYSNPSGKYFERSPIMHAHKVTTPTLNICGSLDRCTPPSEAVQFHNALLENCVESVLVTYPEEGHGVRKFPAAIDYSARIVGWFEEHLRDA